MTIRLNKQICILFLLCFSFQYFSLEAQNRENYIINIQKAKGKVTVDGILEEADWLLADVAKDFYRVLPIDTGFATAQSEVILTYDDEFFYVGITCFQGKEGENIVESLRRDFSFGKNDNFLLFIDTYNDQTNGFSFGASAAGAQWDGLQANGGFVSLDWDTKWVSETIQYEDRWVVEMAIPFRNMRFKEGVDTWGINFSRLDLKLNEKSSWAPVPRQFQTASLAYTGTLQWDAPPPKPGLNYSLIPFIAASTSKDQINGSPTNNSFDAGLDAKFAVTSSLNLDLTLNPDFSQVEVDRQVTNLDRFELFFPERRRFFLENRDIFTDFGADGIRPFFSRRIGLTSPVNWGAKLSGRLNENWRVGLLNMQTGSSDTIPAANFTVASVQRKMFSRSNLAFIFVNKELTGDYSDTLNLNDYNRVAGIDFNLATADNRWTGKFFLHKSISPESEGKDFVFSSNVLYNTGNVSLLLEQSSVGENYLSEVGFVRRQGFHRFQSMLIYKFFPGTPGIENHGPTFELDWFYNTKFELTDRNVSAGYFLRWLNRSQVSIQYDHKFVQLLDPFDPTNTNGIQLVQGTALNWGSLKLAYNSDARKVFAYEIASRFGGFFNGNRFNLEGNLIYRYQPLGSLSLNFSYNKIELPEPFSDANFILVGPKLDITFTDAIFLTTFIQYNNQIDNINMNIRFQWRYQPGSDLFIVYTDNYFPENLQIKNRALVAKLSYWFN